ncbi:ketimine reductase mu-crystallin-like isoform X2 [Ostrea edulis]|nr:ketimine reductase mu-crystallin-like isoform X2 [Ostrea edulis]XP_056018879.1 ketimine reductase mu-crystallin-like isoform X2 [Ostrea edulis]
MPAYSPEDEALATKLVTFFPQNTDVPTHNAIIAVFNSKTGIPEIIMDGEVITTMRTAAVSAVATQHLCAPNPQILAVLGSGVQARSHIQALSSIMSFNKIKIWSRTRKNADILAGEVDGTAYDSAQEAVKDADVIITVTSSEKPVLKKEWVKPGAHINAVGACCPDWQEIDPDLVRSSVLYVDSRDAALKESGDVIMAKAEIFAELGEMLLGLKDAKVHETTLFKSLGLAIEDVMSAKLVQNLLKKT